MTETLTTEQFHAMRGTTPLKVQPREAKPAKPTTRVPSELEQRFMDNSGRLPPFEREYKFCDRKWRFDFAWPSIKLAVEIQGGNFKNGGHNRGASQGRDFEKINEAQLAGWRVLQFGTKQMDSIDEVIEVVLAAISASPILGQGPVASTPAAIGGGE